jgi:CRP/FNR family transcriptional regulator
VKHVYLPSHMFRDDELQLASNLLLDCLNRFADLDTAQRARLVERLQPLRVRRNEALLEPGQSARFVDFVAEGLLEMSVPDLTGDRVVDFLPPGSFATDYLNLLLGRNAEVRIVALRDSLLLRLDASSLEELYGTHIEFQKLGRRIAESHYIEFVQRLRWSHLPPDERYFNFCQDHPDLAQMVPQYRIASFLGVSAEWLSKIRARRNKSSVS